MDAMTLRALATLYDAYDAVTTARDGDLDEWLTAVERVVEREVQLARLLGLEARP